MGKKDTLMKEYMSNPKRFADAFNSCLFGGKKIILPERLTEKDPTELSIILQDDEKEVGQKVRDILKEAVVFEDEEMKYVLLGIENQTDIHYGMVVKNLIYDALNYGRQMKLITTRHKENKDIKGDEFLSGFSREDRLKPVITLTIYFGKKEWDGARSLHELLDIKNPELLKFISNYEINLVVPREIEDFSVFKTDIRNVLEFIKFSDDKDKIKEVVVSDKSYKKLSVEAVNIINEITGAGIPIEKDKEEVDMCKGILELKQEGFEEGREEGREESLRAIVQSIKIFVTDKTELCKIIRGNEGFEKYSDEEILKYY